MRTAVEASESEDVDRKAASGSSGVWGSTELAIREPGDEAGMTVS